MDVQLCCSVADELLQCPATIAFSSILWKNVYSYLSPAVLRIEIEKIDDAYSDISFYFFCLYHQPHLLVSIDITCAIEDIFTQ